MRASEGFRASIGLALDHEEEAIAPRWVRARARRAQGKRFVHMYVNS
jgi:hypothetical protein